MRNLIIVVGILLFALPVLAEGGQAVAVLLDVSKSVPPEQFFKAKEIVRNLEDQASSFDAISIYAFGDTLRRIDRADLNSLQASESYTLLYDAAYDVARDLEKVNSDQKAILVISDGKDTKSATILEDTVAYANSRGISIYSIGVGQAQQKSMERIAKLTDGKYFHLEDPGIIEEFRMLVSQQKTAPGNIQPSVMESNLQPVAKAPTAVAQQAPTPSAEPVKKKKGSSMLWIGVILGSALLLLMGALILSRILSREKRVCPTCHRTLKASQKQCPNCTATIPDRIPGDGTQEIPKPSMPLPVEELIPKELLEKKPDFDTSITKTFVLMETPVLVVRKGKNIGQTFSLNPLYPVTIGRSRVNEIRVEDASVSGQHCRIIPENGKHVLYDLTSTNGTFVNDKKVSKEHLKEGDIIRIGETQFLYRVEHGAQ
jgi:FHA domain/von Willebrand factor type A domain